MLFVPVGDSYSTFWTVYSRVSEFTKRNENGKFYDIQTEYGLRRWDPGFNVVLAFNDALEIVGFYVMHARDANTTINLWLFAVIDDHQNKGYGKEIYTSFIKRTCNYFRDSNVSTFKITSKTHVTRKRAMHKLLVDTQSIIPLAEITVIPLDAGWAKYLINYSC